MHTQKRGLHHAHILIILADDFIPREPSDYDNIVCAEIPVLNIDPILSPTLHRIVKRCMIRDPCGISKKGAPCLRDGSCSKQFPKNLSTSSTKDGYPLYRRRENSRTVEVGGIKLRDQWVVPDNPYPLLRFNAHINVEIDISLRMKLAIEYSLLNFMQIFVCYEASALS